LKSDNLLAGRVDAVAIEDGSQFDLAIEAAHKLVLATLRREG
jgi:hypothetical protein